MKTTLLRFLLVIGLLLPATTTAQAQHIQSFGYVVDTSHNFTWVELNGTDALIIDFYPNYNDQVASIPLGITFPFYENNYDGVNVSTNGLIFFGGSSAQSYPANQPIPTEYAPRNLIAAYWDNLTLVDDPDPSQVYYKMFDSCPVLDEIPCTIIEYYRVLKMYDGGSPRFDFQIILFSDGNILLSYQSLPLTINSCTVGIEDDQGADGEQVYYNEPGLVPEMSIKFTYPDAGNRVKAFPLYQGGFMEFNQVDFPFTVRNTGNYEDTYTFSHLVLDGKSELDGWAFILVDDQGDEIPPTGIPLEPGVETHLSMRISTPGTAQHGDFSKISVTVHPTSAESVEILMQAAVPAPFAAILMENNTIQTQFVTPSRSITRDLKTGYSGAALSILQIDATKYLAQWEISGSAGGAGYTNQVFSRVNAVGKAGPPFVLWDHGSDNPAVKDKGMAACQAPNGQIGMVFIRNKESVGEQAVIFAMIDPSWEVMHEVEVEVNDSYPFPYWDYPAITASTNNEFYLAWYKFDENQELGDLWYAVISSEGEMIVYPRSLTNDLPGGVFYFDISLAPLENGEILAAYNEFEYGVKNNLVYQTILGDVVSPPVLLSEMDYYTKIDMTILDGGIPLLAWIDEDADTGNFHLYHALLDSEDSAILQSPVLLEMPDNRQPANLSVTTDNDGHGVLVWGETGSEKIYYALLDSNGIVLTPPMPFRSAEPGEILHPGSEGKSVAPCPDVLLWTTMLPAIIR